MCEPKWFKSYCNAACYNEFHIFWAQVALLTKEKGMTVCWRSSQALSQSRNRGGLPTTGLVNHRNLGFYGPGHTVHLSLLEDIFQELTDTCVCRHGLVCQSVCVYVCTRCVRAPPYAFHLLFGLLQTSCDREEVGPPCADWSSHSSSSRSIPARTPPHREVICCHGVAAPSAHPSCSHQPLGGEQHQPWCVFLRHS